MRIIQEAVASKLQKKHRAAWETLSRWIKESLKRDRLSTSFFYFRTGPVFIYKENC